METILRAAKEKDLEQLNQMMFELHSEHHRDCPEHFKTAEEIEQEKSIARYLDNPECLVYVATDGDRVCGFISGHFCELISSVSKPIQMGNVDELYVFPEYRRKGVAKQLVQKMLDNFDDYGVAQVFVEVWHFNNAAQTFYQDLGFEHHIHWMRKPI